TMVRYKQIDEFIGRNFSGATQGYEAIIGTVALDLITGQPRNSGCPAISVRFAVIHVFASRQHSHEEGRYRLVLPCRTSHLFALDTRGYRREHCRSSAV